jgi:cytochrome c-type biogenesis protein CcsB
VSLDSGLFSVVLALYFCAAVVHHAHLFSGGVRSARIATALVWLCVIVHGIAIVERALLRGIPPFSSSFESMSFIAWLIAVFQLVLQIRYGWTAIGALSMPIAFVAVFYAKFLPRSSFADATLLESPFRSPHVLATILGFVSFALAFCFAVAYLVQNRLLKRKQVKGIMRRLPPLEAISVSAHWLAAAGFSMLTLGIITGAIWAMRAWRANWYLDPKVVTSFIAWLIYASYLFFSSVRGWRGYKTTYFLIAGFVVLLIAYFGVNWVSHGQHPF